MANSEKTKNNLSQLYAQIVGERGSQHENQSQNFDLKTISGYAKEEYETRTFTNLNNVKF